MNVTRLKRYPLVYANPLKLNGDLSLGARVDVVFYDTTNHSFGGKIESVGANALTN